MLNSRRGVLVTVVAGMVLAAAPVEGQVALEVRGGFNLPTFKIADAAEAGPSVGAGLNAGAGAMTFKVDGGSSFTYPAINVGAKLIFGLGVKLSLVISPQGDIAFSKKSELGTSNSWVWPFAAGLRINF